MSFIRNMKFHKLSPGVLPWATPCLLFSMWFYAYPSWKNNAHSKRSAVPIRVWHFFSHLYVSSSPAIIGRITEGPNVVDLPILPRDTRQSKVRHLFRDAAERRGISRIVKIPELFRRLRLKPHGVPRCPETVTANRSAPIGVIKR